MRVVVGTNDQLFFADKFEPVISKYAEADVRLVDGLTHMGVVVAPQFSQLSKNDGFVKRPISSLRCIPSEFHVLYVRCIPRDLRRLDLELFTLPSEN